MVQQEFVIDSANVDKFERSRDNLWKGVIENRKLDQNPLLILANKQDLPKAQSAEAIAKALHLQNIKSNPFTTNPCSARTGLNLRESIKWLRKRI